MGSSYRYFYFGLLALGLIAFLPQNALAGDTLQVSADTLVHITIHQDSRVRQNPVIVASGRIDTRTGITYDTLTRFGIVVDTNATLDTSFDSVYLSFVGDTGTETFTLSRTDSAYRVTGLTKQFSDSAYWRVFVHLHDSSRIGGTLTATLKRDSIATSFRDSGPLSDTTFGRIVTIDRPRVAITPNTLAAITIHPDSKALQEPVLVGSGYIGSDTFNGSALTFDTVTRFGIVIDSTTIGGVPLVFDSVFVAISGATGFDTFVLSRQNGTDSYSGTINKGITDSGFFRIYVSVTDTAPNGSTFTASIIKDSVQTALRDSGPQGGVLSVTFGRTVTIDHPRVAIISDSLGNITVNPDSKALQLPVLAGSGYITSDTFAGAALTYDTVTRFGIVIDSTTIGGVPLVFDSVFVVINGTSGFDTFVLTRQNGTDSFSNNTMTKGINDSAAFRIFISVTDTAPNGSTFTAHILKDSVQTSFRDSGGAVVASFARTVTIDHPRVAIISDSLGNITVNPDSKALQLPVLAGSGYITSDTFAGAALTYDTVTRFGIVIDSTTIGGVPLVFDSVFVVINGTSGFDTFVLTRQNGTDSFSNNTMTKGINDSAAFRIFVSVTDTAPNGSTFTAHILKDSVQTSFRDSGGAVVASFARTVTIDHPRVAIISDSLGNLTVHPDSKVGQLPVLAGSGYITSDTFSGSALTYDTITRFGLAIESTPIAGGVPLVFDSVFISITASGVTDTYPLTRLGAAFDTYSAAFTKSMGDSAYFRIFVSVTDTAVNGTTFRVLIPKDSVATSFRDSGPEGGTSLAPSFARTITIDHPRVAITSNTLASVTIHPDSRAGVTPVLAASGYIGSDTFAGVALSVDTITRFGVSIDTVSTAYQVTLFDSVFVVLYGTTGAESFTLNRLYNTGDSYSADIAKLIGDSVFFQVFLDPHDTIRAATTATTRIVRDSVVTSFRDSGPSTTANFGRVVTFDSGSISILTANRDTSLSANIQRGDTKALMWFHANSPVEVDTMNQLTINIQIVDTSSIDTVFLVRDGNRNRLWDTATGNSDTYVGRFVYTGGSTGTPGIESWTLVIVNAAVDSMILDTVGVGKKGDTAEYLIVVHIRDTAPSTSTSIRVSVPALGADARFAESGPVTRVSYDTYFIIGSDTTPPGAVTSFTVTATQGLFTLNWGASSSGDTGMTGGQYNLYWDSGLASDTFSLIFTKTHDTGVTSYQTTLSGLQAESTYRFKVVAQDSAGNTSVASNIVSAVFIGATATLSTAQATMVQPTTGDRVGRSLRQLIISRVSSAQASLVTGVRFEWRFASESGAFRQLGAVSTDTSVDQNGNVYYTTEVNTLDSSPELGYQPNNDTVVEVRAAARVSSGFDTYPVSVSFTLLKVDTTTGAPDTRTATYYAVSGDSRLSALGDTAYLDRTVTMLNPVTILISSASDAFDVILQLGAGSLGQGADTARFEITVQRDTFIDSGQVAFKRAGVRLPSYWINIALKSTTLSGNPDTNLSGNSNRLVLSYIDNNNDFIDDSTGVDMRKAVIYTLNGATGRIQALVTERDHTRKILYGVITHFSPFAISDAQGANNQGLSRLIVGPNPFRPNDGSDETGKNFVAGDATTGIVFRNVAPNTRIDIYTILGERVTTLYNTATGATIAWSVKNDDNVDCASGYYLYVATDPATGQRVTGKVAVIR